MIVCVCVCVCECVCVCLCVSVCVWERERERERDSFVIAWYGSTARAPLAPCGQYVICIFDFSLSSSPTHVLLAYTISRSLSLSFFLSLLNVPLLTCLSVYLYLSLCLSFSVPMSSSLSLTVSLLSVRVFLPNTKYLSMSNALNLSLIFCLHLPVQR